MARRIILRYFTFLHTGGNFPAGKCRMIPSHWFPTCRSGMQSIGRNMLQHTGMGHSCTATVSRSLLVCPGCLPRVALRSRRGGPRHAGHIVRQVIDAVSHIIYHVPQDSSGSRRPSGTGRSYSGSCHRSGSPWSFPLRRFPYPEPWSYYFRSFFRMLS